VVLAIGDDGVGFDVVSASRNGLGLISMHERLESVGGRLTIRSTPGAGTRLAIVLPARVLKAELATPMSQVPSAARAS